MTKGNRLAGKVAIVAGAGSVGPGWGNGRATAVYFAREGAEVLAVDRDRSALDETLQRAAQEDGSIAPYSCDMTESGQIQQMVDAARQAYGRIDILVNVVGGSMPGGAVELDEAIWKRQLEYNLGSVFLSCKHVIPVMAEHGGGSIVNIASASGIRYTGAPQVAYASAKAGVIQLSRVTAVQYAKDGVRVNSVIPGQMHTPMVEARLANQRAGGDVERLLEQRQARIPLDFMGDGRDIANAALYLASDDARFVTGTELIVDGGMSARCD